MFAAAMSVRRDGRSRGGPHRSRAEQTQYSIGGMAGSAFIPTLRRKAPHRTARCLMLEAVPGKTGRTEFQGGRWNRGLWWNCAPTRNRKSGIGQASTYGCARQRPTRRRGTGLAGDPPVRDEEPSEDASDVGEGDPAPFPVGRGKVLGDPLPSPPSDGEKGDAEGLEPVEAGTNGEAAVEDERARECTGAGAADLDPSWHFCDSAHHLSDCYSVVNFSTERRLALQDRRFCAPFSAGFGSDEWRV